MMGDLYGVKANIASIELQTDESSRPSFFNPIASKDARQLSDIPKTTTSNHQLLGSPTEDSENRNPPHQQTNTDFRSSASQKCDNKTLSVASGPITHQRNDNLINISKVEATQWAMLERKKMAAKQEVFGQPLIIRTKSICESNDDYGWMHETKNIDKEYEELVNKVRALQQRKTNGKILDSESIMLARLKNELLLQTKLRDAAAKADNGEDENDSLFVPEESLHEAAQRHLRTAPDIFKDRLSDNGVKEEETAETQKSAMVDKMDVDEVDAALSNSESENNPLQKKPRKTRRKPARTAREVYERQREDQQSRERQKAQKSQKKKTRRLPKKPRKDSKAKGIQATKKQKEGLKISNDMVNILNNISVDRRSREDAVARQFLDEMISGDQILDRITDPIFNNAPRKAIFARRKGTQFQKLLEDIPQGSNVKSARSDKEKLNKASKSFGHRQVDAVDGMWLVKGMKSSLYHHQLLGAQWMLSREFGTGEPPFGGLLADAMGLGKTVQTLACMVGNPPQEEDRRRGRGATLIIAPSTIIPQWMDEIYVHANESLFPKLCHYSTRSKLSKAVVESLDIVVTSYTEVMRQFPWPESKEEMKLMRKIGLEAWQHDTRRQAGVLHNISWYRVVLDEAHAIKNDSGRTSKACQNLTSLYKWCLTGTPLMNKLDEMYPYLRFIGADYDIDWDIFRKKCCDPGRDESYARLAVLLSNTMLRRTMKTPILNRPIITLPMPHPEIRYATFSPQESLIYRITEKCFRAAINLYLENGSAAFNYTHIFVFLLRLRQCASHPFMLEETIKECWGEDEIEMLKDGLAKLSEDHTPFYEQCAAWVKLSEKERQARKEAGEHGGNAYRLPESMPFGASDFGHHFKMHLLLTEKPAEEIICSVCGNLVGEGIKTNCEHIFCQGCLESIMHRDAAADDFDCFVCPYCDKVFTDITPFNRGQLNPSNEAETLDFDDMLSRPQLQEGLRGKRRSLTGPGTDEMGFEPSSAPSTWLSAIDNDPNAEIVPSTKITVLKSLLLEAFEEAPLDKVVIYVQFRLVARIIGRMCKKENWKFVYLTGDATLDHRTNAINTFREKDDVRILIAGLRCGGLGLNLAFANRCISLDLWWNHAVERQAFGRIFRLGQLKETRMTRIAVRDTIDMRFLSIQLYKMTACDKAMEERTKLGLAELVKLFGFIRTDKDKNIIQVEPDYLDEAVQETTQDCDEILSGELMGGSGIYAGGDWSFGDRAGFETDIHNIASGSGTTKALGSIAASTSTLVSGSPLQRASGHSTGALFASAPTFASCSSSFTSLGTSPASIWGSSKDSSFRSDFNSVPTAVGALSTNAISASASRFGAGLGSDRPSTSMPNADYRSKSNPIKMEDCTSWDSTNSFNYENRRAHGN